MLLLYPKGYFKNKMTLSGFIKEKRVSSRLTQPQLADKAGVGLRFVRDLEQGKETLRLDKVNQVLRLFGYELGPTPIDTSQLLKAVPKEYNLPTDNPLSKAAEI
jgi:y4mF family transcriptional regulator